MYIQKSNLEKLPVKFFIKLKTMWVMWDKRRDDSWFSMTSDSS